MSLSKSAPSMVIFTNEPLSFDLSIGELSKHDSKANMLETFQLIGVGVAKSWDKTSLATVMDDVFEHSPALFANILPKEERKPVSGPAGMQAGRICHLPC